MMSIYHRYALLAQRNRNSLVLQANPYMYGQFPGVSGQMAGMGQLPVQFAAPTNTSIESQGKDLTLAQCS